MNSDIERLLVKLNYPFISVTKQEKAKEAVDLDRLEAAGQAFKKICDIYLSIDLPLLSHMKLTESQLEKLVNILVAPFRKRFNFHFLGNRKTNNQEKPEWYLSQILKWIRDHEKFLNSHLQPIISNHKVYKDKFILVSTISNQTVFL